VPTTRFLASALRHHSMEPVQVDRRRNLRLGVLSPSPVSASGGVLRDSVSVVGLLPFAVIAVVFCVAVVVQAAQYAFRLEKEVVTLCTP